MESPKPRRCTTTMFWKFRSTPFPKQPECSKVDKVKLEQADEAMDSAQLLLERGNYRTVVNRAYYAMFYAVLALLVPTKQQTSKHAWVMTLFDRDFVRLGVFGKDFSRWLHEAFNLRQRSDYQELITVLRLSGISHRIT